MVWLVQHELADTGHIFSQACAFGACGLMEFRQWLRDDCVTHLPFLPDQLDTAVWKMNPTAKWLGLPSAFLGMGPLCLSVCNGWCT